MSEGTIRVGTMGWSYPFWAGNFYPKGTSPGDYLAEYAKRFETVEVDSTFYGIPREPSVKGWHDATPRGFIFAAKFPRRIGEKRFLGVKGETEVFVGRMEGLGDKLGPFLLQLPHDFGPGDVAALAGYLGSLPASHRYAVEARGKELPEGLIQALRENGAALVLLDGHRAPAEDILTADFSYVRLKGGDPKIKGTTGAKEADRTKDIERWAGRLKTLSRRTGEIFVYFSKYYSGHSPTDALTLKRLLATS